MPPFTIFMTYEEALEHKDNPRVQYFVSELERLEQSKKDAQELLNIADMKDMAEEELMDISKQQEEILNQIAENLKKEAEEEEFPNEIILEVRAGAGGDEASIFANELAHMYQLYAEKMNWGVVKMEESLSAVGGYKEASFEIRGQDVYRKLRYETGVHRVQRIPKTESKGRVHTSTASVAILPMRKKTKLVLRPEDLEWEFSRAGGKGGQNVNKVETAARVIHIPTGFDVRSTAQRSQLKNKETALAILTAKIAQYFKDQDDAKYSADRKDQIGTSDRSEKIRTYNFPQNRITDHRIKESWHNIEDVMSGELDSIVEAFANL